MSPPAYGSSTDSLSLRKSTSDATFNVVYGGPSTEALEKRVETLEKTNELLVHEKDVSVSSLFCCKMLTGAKRLQAKVQFKVAKIHKLREDVATLEDKAKKSVAAVSSLVTPPPSETYNKAYDETVALLVADRNRSAMLESRLTGVERERDELLTMSIREMARSDTGGGKCPSQSPARLLRMSTDDFSRLDEQLGRSSPQTARGAI